MSKLYNVNVCKFNSPEAFDDERAKSFNRVMKYRKQLEVAKKKLKNWKNKPNTHPYELALEVQRWEEKIKEEYGKCRLMLV